VTNETLAQVWQRIQIEDTPYRGYALKTRRNMAQLYEKWVPIKSLPFSDINERHWLDTIDTALKANKPGQAETLENFVDSFYRCANALPELAGASHQGTHGAGIAFALDQVTLPVPRKLAVLNLRWAQVDTELIGDVAASILAFNAREAFISSLSQTINPAAINETAPCPEIQCPLGFEGALSYGKQWPS